jgi:hypothetical protein
MLKITHSISRLGIIHCLSVTRSLDTSFVLSARIEIMRSRFNKLDNIKLLYGYCWPKYN